MEHEDFLNNLIEGKDPEFERRVRNIIESFDPIHPDEDLLEAISMASGEYVAEFMTARLREDKYFDPENKFFKIFPDENENENFEDAYFEYLKEKNGNCELRLVIKNKDENNIYITSDGLENLTEILINRLSKGEEDGL